MVEEFDGKGWGWRNSIISVCYLAIGGQYAFNNVLFLWSDLGTASDFIHFVSFILLCLSVESDSNLENSYWNRIISNPFFHNQDKKQSTKM